MINFQVGDRVSVEGVVTAIFQHDYVQIQICTKAGTLIQLEPDELTLIERPRRKLRVGSVWHPAGSPLARYVVTHYDQEQEQFIEVASGTVFPRDALTFDMARTPWREVPVEELEREAT